MKRGIARVALTAATFAALLGLAQPAAAAGPAGSRAAQPPLVGGAGSTCFWHYGPIGAPPRAFNIATLDLNTTYWAAVLRRPPGSTLKLHGKFPYARYTSLISYDALGQVVDGIADYQIDPDRGSTNPFRPGAHRLMAKSHRNYTVSLRDHANLDPATGQPIFNTRDPRSNEKPRNYLYAKATTPFEETVGGQTYQLETLMVRVFVPNKGYGIRGGVPLPKPEIVLADGTTLRGRTLCNALDTEAKDRLANGLGERLPDPTALLIQPSFYEALRYPDRLSEPCDVTARFVPTCPTTFTVPPALVQVPRQVPPTFPAQNPVQWRADYDRRYLLQLYTGDDAPGASLDPGRSGAAGFFPNPHVNYMRAALNRKFGKVIAFRGKLATTPRTYGGTPVMRATQLRYQSFCMTESVATTKTTDCAYDEQIPLTSRRGYVVVASRREDRPRNARRRCGVAWIRWPDRGDGAGDRDFGWLQMRNMLPSPGFHHSIQDTQKPGDEKQVLGSHLPRGTYYDSKRAFERLGCPVKPHAR